MLETQLRRPAPTTSSQATPTKAATPAVKPAAALPAYVLAELQRNAAKIKGMAGRPNLMASFLNEWIEKHTRERLMNQTVKANLGEHGAAIPGWADGASNGLAGTLLGPAAAQDITSGVTRRLTETRHALGQVGLGNPTGAYQARDTLGSAATSHDVAILKGILGAIPAKDRHAVAAAYAKQNGGKTLSATLGELIRDANQRGPLMALLPPPMNEETLTLDTFLEQLSVGLVYSNQTAEEMNADTVDERRGGNPAAVLKHFGFKAGPLILGRWGFQMRMFTPIPGKAKWAHPIVSFRGTEGVMYDPLGNDAAKAAKAKGGSVAEQAQARQKGVEGTVDTIIGDLSPKQVGWYHVQPNEDLILANLQRLKGKAISTGHSLGGAIAQLVPALHPEYFGSVVTFQAANIDKAEVAKMRQHNAGQADPVLARHYRVEGDIVPTAGQQALDGQITYFDRVSRDKGTSEPFGNSALENIASGHVTPMLSTYIRGQKNLSEDLQVIADQGLRDEGTLSAKPGEKVQDVKTVFAGNYSTAQDPRIQAENKRLTLANNVGLYPGTDLFEATVYANIAYNTLLSHVENLAADKTIKTLAEFKKRANELMKGSAPLPLDPDDVALSKVLKMDHYETDYAARPMSTGYGIPIYPKKATPIDTYFRQGVRVPDYVEQQVRDQLDIIWKSWRGQ
ncbi:hypothetical protein GO986_20685 [Deinococcus sp. HMF7620]|uniref:Fungal lipase-like domain-containing protein n=1 Tax=Deinococcus arboris TaxID=2682977 RepID=A0A7C9LR66_9DEIO|nr:hypothetical protein [Deinococcus arboris]MVN89156.1 hypothetical protein [Deinococcus arboris]